MIIKFIKNSIILNFLKIIKKFINNFFVKFKFLIQNVLFIYNKGMLQGIISKLYKIHGTNIINATTIGNSIVQQYAINWS